MPAPGPEHVPPEAFADAFAAPEVLLTGPEPTRSVEVKVANPGAERLAGTLRFTARRGFRVAPESVALDLAPGADAAVTVKVRKDGVLEAGMVTIRVKLERAKGGFGIDATIPIECTGDLARIVLPVSADTSVNRMNDRRRGGSSKAIQVIGGKSRFRDRGYVRFPLAFPFLSWCK